MAVSGAIIPFGGKPTRNEFAELKRPGGRQLPKSSNGLILERQAKPETLAERVELWRTRVSRITEHASTGGQHVSSSVTVWRPFSMTIAWLVPRT